MTWCNSNQNAPDALTAADQITVIRFDERSGEFPIKYVLKQLANFCTLTIHCPFVCPAPVVFEVKVEAGDI